MLANAQPKPKAKRLEKAQRQRALAKVDREQRAICRERSGGRCEVIEQVIEHAGWVGTREIPKLETLLRRCTYRATENHHLLGGIGRRNRGKSILAEHRLDVCKACHEAITGKRLVPAVPKDLAGLAASVRYERK